MTSRHIIYNWHISKFNFYLGLILAGGIILFLVQTKHLAKLWHPVIAEPFLIPPIQAVCDSKTIATEAVIKPTPTKAKLPDTITPAPTNPLQTQQFVKPTTAIVTCKSGLNVAPPTVAIQNTIISYVNDIPATQINTVIAVLNTNPITAPLVSEYELTQIKLIAGLIILLNNVAMYSQPAEPTVGTSINNIPESAPLTQEEKNVVGYVLNSMLNSINPVLSQFTNKYFSGQEPNNVIQDLLANIQPAPPAIKPDDLAQIMTTPIQRASAEQAQTSELYITEQIKKGNVLLDAEKCIAMLESGYRFT